jgi:hypothetical protein
MKATIAKSRCVELCGRSKHPILVAIVSVVFYCLYYFIICKLPVIGIPTFRIDYFATTVTDVHSNPLKFLSRARPVTEIFVYIQAVLANFLFSGQTKYIIYPLQHITLLIYFFSISKVVESILNVRFHVFAFLAAWFLFAANPGVVEGVYKLESIVGTLSMLFGGLALYFLDRWDRNRNYSSAITFILFYLLSIFAKEDFILPPLFLLGWYLVRNGDWKQQIVTHKWFLITTTSVVFLFLIYNEFIIVNRSYMNPVHNTGHPYYMTLNPVSVAKVVFHYIVGVGLHIKLLNLLYLISTLTVLIIGKKQKEVFMITLIMLGMMAPYSIMPNHEFTYYGLKWWVWQALASLALVQIIFAQRAMMVTGLFCAFILLFVLIHVDKNPSRFFRERLAISENIQSTLEMNRVAINAQKQVAVIGIGPGQIIHTPWQKNGELGFFLRDDLKLNTQWIIFVESGDALYTIDENIQPGSNLVSMVIVKNIEDIKNFDNIPRLVFSPDGRGSFSAIEE